MKLAHQWGVNKYLARSAKKTAELWRFLLLLLVVFLFVLAIVFNALAIVDTDHPTPAAAMFGSADYTGIMTTVSIENDPNLFYADQALDNILHVWPRLEPYQYQNEIDWEVGDRSRVWYICFQSLRVVGYLSNAAEVSGSVSYLAKAAEIIGSWYDFHHDNKKPPPYAWYDHTVAWRIQNVVHFLRAYSSLHDVQLPGPFAEKVAAMLHQDATWLLDERNYHPNNHGMMASMALIQMALTFPELDDSGLWKEMGLSRIRERIQADLSVENVHMEHSAAYHLFFLNLVLQVEGYLDTKGVMLFEPADRTIEEMKQYVGYMVKPDCRIPVIGDTNDSALPTDYDQPWVRYSLSVGEEGVVPPDNSVVYPDVGVAIFRDEWRTASKFPDTTYLFFQSAFHSTTHKHADDLSFILYSRGEDIFVGPGVYDYDTSKYRQYITSTQAHNTLTVDGESYVISRDKVGKAGITAYKLGEAFDFVQGSHTMYGGVTLKRGIVFIRPSTILVIDEAVSGTEHSIQQVWNLSLAAHDLKFDRDGASFLVGENGVSVEIRQLSPVVGVNHYYGQEDPLRGFISPRQFELVPIDQLEFESYGSGTAFVTQITVTEPGEDIPTIEVDPDNPYQAIVVHHSDGTTLTINLESELQP